MIHHICTRWPADILQVCSWSTLILPCACLSVCDPLEDLHIRERGLGNFGRTGTSNSLSWLFSNFQTIQPSVRRRSTKPKACGVGVHLHLLEMCATQPARCTVAFHLLYNGVFSHKFYFLYNFVHNLFALQNKILHQSFFFFAVRAHCVQVRLYSTEINSAWKVSWLLCRKFLLT